MPHVHLLIGTILLISAFFGESQKMRWAAVEWGGWTAHTGGDTYWGNIQAGKNAIAFIDWIAEQPSSEKATDILISAVKRKCG